MFFICLCDLVLSPYLSFLQLSLSLFPFSPNSLFFFSFALGIFGVVLFCFSLFFYYFIFFNVKASYIRNKASKIIRT
jgi:hypothetical protein